MHVGFFAGHIAALDSALDSLLNAFPIYVFLGLALTTFLPRASLTLFADHFANCRKFLSAFFFGELALGNRLVNLACSFIVILTADMFRIGLAFPGHAFFDCLVLRVGLFAGYSTTLNGALDSLLNAFPIHIFLTAIFTPGAFLTAIALPGQSLFHALETGLALLFGYLAGFYRRLDLRHGRFVIRLGISFFNAAFALLGHRRSFPDPFLGGLVLLCRVFCANLADLDSLAEFLLHLRQIGSFRA